MIDWRHWHNEPILVGGLVLLGWMWAVLAGPFRARLATVAGAPADLEFPRGAAACFYSALLIFYLAVGSPLDQVAEGYLLSVHMLQHQLLVYPAAILFLLGLPWWMIDPVIGAPSVRWLMRFVTRPVVAAALFLLVFGGWHSPWLYSAALNHKVIHVLEHVTMFGAALLYWWPVLSRSRAFPPLGYGAQMLYLLGVIIGLMPIHAYITFSHDTLYPTYEYAPRLIRSFSPQDDQLLAGVSMQLLAMVVSMIAFTVAFYRWYRKGERSAPKARAGVSSPRPE